MLLLQLCIALTSSSMRAQALLSLINQTEDLHLFTELFFRGEGTERKGKRPGYKHSQDIATSPLCRTASYVNRMRTQNEYRSMELHKPALRPKESSTICLDTDYILLFRQQKRVRRLLSSSCAKPVTSPVSSHITISLFALIRLHTATLYTEAGRDIPLF